MPRPLDWVDRSVPSGGGSTTSARASTTRRHRATRVLEPRGATRLELDGTAPGPGPTVVPEVVTPDGRLEPSQGVQYMVADAGVSPVGR